VAMGGVGDTGRSKTTRPQGDTRPSAANARGAGRREPGTANQNAEHQGGHGNERRADREHGGGGVPEPTGRGGEGAPVAALSLVSPRRCGGGPVVAVRSRRRRGQPQQAHGVTSVAGANGEASGSPNRPQGAIAGGAAHPRRRGWRAAGARWRHQRRQPRRCGGGYVVAVQPPPPRSAKKSAWGDIGGRGKRGGQWQPKSTPRCHRARGRSPPRRRGWRAAGVRGRHRRQLLAVAAAAAAAQAGVGRGPARVAAHGSRRRGTCQARLGGARPRRGSRCGHCRGVARPPHKVPGRERAARPATTVLLLRCQPCYRLRVPNAARRVRCVAPAMTADLSANRATGCPARRAGGQAGWPGGEGAACTYRYRYVARARRGMWHGPWPAWRLVNLVWFNDRSFG